VIITCLNEEENIKACLESLINQTYSTGRYEIIVVDGGSTDRSQNLVKEFEKAYLHVHLVVEVKKGTAAGRNAGIKAGQYDHIAFIDADCEAPPDWLATLVKHYQDIIRKDKRVIAVGGTNIPPEYAHKFIQAVGITLDSYLGSFTSVQGRRFKKPIYVPSLANLNVLYNKQKIVEIGYYDESLGGEGEDADINYRLNISGNRFLFVPDSFVWHKMRPTPATWLKNMFRYGKSRARLLKRYPRMWDFSFTLPVFFIAAMCLILFIPFSKIFLVSIFYFPSLFLYAMFQCIRKKSLGLVFHVMLVYLIQHSGYAAGEVYGLLNPKVR